MTERDTTGKDALEERLDGDPALAQIMSGALGATVLPERGTHGFHTYPAGLHPDAARDLMAAFPGRSVLDPFCGGGTVLVEGRIAGRITYGRDLSTVAMRVSRARVAAPSDEALTAFRSTARKLTEAARQSIEPAPADLFDTVHDWYAPHTIKELWSLYQGIGQVEDEEVKKQLQAVFSSILIKVSWRKSDTSAKRQKHHRPAGTAAILFHKKARELARLQTDLRERIPEGTPETKLRLQDARRVRVPKPVDLVLTSPPYPAVYDYLPLQHLRRVWMGSADGEHPGDEIGARRHWREKSRAARRRWAADTAAWTAASARALAPGGHLVVVVGDGLTPTGPVDTVAASLDGAKAAGLEPVARASLLRPDHARETSRWEHVFAWRRP
ncbi:MAG: hypothetical protein AB8H79_07745 [Myxococcota bacterium]